MSFSVDHLAYISSVCKLLFLLKFLLNILQILNWIQDVYKEIYSTVANSDVLTFLKCELVHIIWCLFINEDFINVYTFGIIMLH